jgi:hypothetical protein
VRLLFFEPGAAKAFTQLTAQDISFADLEVRILGKGGKRRDVPLLQSLVNELRLHLGERRSGPVFRSRQGVRAYSKRRIQQVVRSWRPRRPGSKSASTRTFSATPPECSTSPTGECRRTFCSSLSLTPGLRRPKSTTSRAAGR